jgi:glycosyltransferase involved in cell wall biosynthesis
VLTWGLIGPGKGLEYGIEAMASLRDLDPAPTYVIAGETHPKVAAREGEGYRERLMKSAVDLGIADQVVFEDRYLDGSSLRALARAADVILLPYESREQICSGVLVEAVSAGKPVVATAFPHAIELLATACGIVVPHGDPEAIAGALRRLFTDEDLARSMRVEASAVAARLTWPAVGREYLRLLHRVLSEGRAA